MMDTFQVGTRVKIFYLRSFSAEDQKRYAKHHPLLDNLRGTIERFTSWGAAVVRFDIEEFRGVINNVFSLGALDPLTEAEAKEEAEGRYHLDKWGIGLTHQTKILKHVFKHPDTFYWKGKLAPSVTHSYTLSWDSGAKVYTGPLSDDPNGVGLLWTDVPEEYRRLGFGTAVVLRTVEAILAEGKTPYALCAFARKVFHDHPIGRVMQIQAMRDILEHVPEQLTDTGTGLQTINPPVVLH